MNDESDVYAVSPRPLWARIPIILFGVAAVGGVIAAGTHYFFYAVLIFPIAMGFAGGLFGVILVGRRGLRSSWWAAGAGLCTAVGVYLAYRGFDWMLATRGTEMSWWSYTLAEVEAGYAVGRRTIHLLEVHGTGVWVMWAIDVAVVTVTGALVGKKVGRQSYINEGDTDGNKRAEGGGVS